MVLGTLREVLSIKRKPNVYIWTNKIRNSYIVSTLDDITRRPYKKEKVIWKIKLFLAVDQTGVSAHYSSLSSRGWPKLPGKLTCGLWLSIINCETDCDRREEHCFVLFHFLVIGRLVLVRLWCLFVCKRTLNTDGIERFCELDHRSINFMDVRAL